MDEYQRHWLAGLLEGEGTFLKPPPSDPKRPILRLSMTDLDVIEKAAALFGTTSYHQHQPERYAEKGWRPVFVVTVKGGRAVQLMRDLYPLLGQRRQAQVDRALAGYEPRRLQISEADARELAARYHTGYRHPTALGKEYGIRKNAAIYYINKYAPIAQ